MANIESLSARQGGSGLRSLGSQRAERRREALLALNHRALQGFDLDELFAETMALACAELELDHCQIWELDSAGEELVLRASTGDFDEASVSISEPLPGPAPGLGEIVGGGARRSFAHSTAWPRRRPRYSARSSARVTA